MSHDVQNNFTQHMLPLHKWRYPWTKDEFINVFLFHLWGQNKTDHICEL